MLARLLKDGAVLREVALHYAGKTSTFAGRMPMEIPGSLQIEVLAMDAVNANFGRTRRSLVVEP